MVEWACSGHVEVSTVRIAMSLAGLGLGLLLGARNPRPPRRSDILSFILATHMCSLTCRVNGHRPLAEKCW